jgi:hypothetical protein
VIFSFPTTGRGHLNTIPGRKRTILQSILLDIELIITTIGFGNIRKAIRRESRAKATHPKGAIYYLWFTGVNTDVRNKGVGSNLLSEVIQEEQFALKLPRRKIFPGMKTHI